MNSQNRNETFTFSRFEVLASSQRGVQQCVDKFKPSIVSNTFGELALDRQTVRMRLALVTVPLHIQRYMSMACPIPRSVTDSGVHLSPSRTMVMVLRFPDFDRHL